MALFRNSSGDDLFIADPADFMEVYNDEGNFIGFAPNDWCYCEYFFNNIQFNFSGKFVDGLFLSEFQKRWDKRWNNITKSLKTQKQFFLDIDFISFQKIMKEKGAHINAYAFYTLCCYIYEIMREKKVVLLMPTMQDTLEELGEVNEVTLSNKEGKKITSSHPELLEIINNHLKNNSKKGEYKLYKIKERKEVYTLETLQVEFAFYFSVFFNEYFKINRKNNGLLCKEEQKILSRVLKFFKLSAAEITGSRFRQLKMHFKDLHNNGQIYHINGKDGKEYFLQMEIIKYKDWKNGKINLLKQSISSIEDGDHFEFTPTFLESMKDCFKDHFDSNNDEINNVNSQDSSD